MYLHDGPDTSARTVVAEGREDASVVQPMMREPLLDFWIVFFTKREIVDWRHWGNEARAFGRHNVSDLGLEVSRA